MNGFLQQNAFDDIDQYSVPQKQILILLLVMDFYEKSLAVIKQGCPLTKIMELDVRNEIIRAKSVVPNDNMEDLTAIQNHLEQQMGELERVYRKDAAV